MLKDDELASLMIDLESDRVERKESISDSEKIRKSICAFANDFPSHNLPGVIFVGVKDDGSCANLSVTDDLLLRLSQMRDDGNILPLPGITVQKRRLCGYDTVVVEVEPSPQPPVRYNGRVWIRVGPRTVQASSAEEQKLCEKRRSKDFSSDLRPIDGATCDELDVEFFRSTYLPSAIAADILAKNHRTVEQQLASLRFLDPEGKPNVGGILVFGKDSGRWIPGAYIQFLRLEGNEITDPIRHQAEITGSLYEQLRHLDEILYANISVSSNVRTASAEIKQPDYPIVALQQLCRNAVLHRTYEGTNSPVRIHWFSDKIEIFNPGGLYGNVNEHNFGRSYVTDYRNPLLAEAMKVLGFVQRFGMGISLARKELEKNGNPDVNFDFASGGVLATLWRRQ